MFDDEKTLDKPNLISLFDETIVESCGKKSL